MKQTKRILSMVLCLLMLVAVVPVMEASAVTTDELASYVQWLVGTSAKEWGSGSGTQCVELPKYYLDNFFGLSTKSIAMGNGNEFYKNVASKYPDKFQRIDYYSGFVPLPGDIISFHSSSSPSYGHAAIVYSVSGNQYNIAEQWKGSGTVRSNTKTVAAGVYGQSYTIIGVARPYCDSPAPVVTWNIEDPNTYPSYPGYNLKTGTKDDFVRFIQTGLNAIGYSCGTADGIFGQKTFDAVWSWQDDNGLTTDGIVGTATWGKLIERFKAKYQKLDIGTNFYAYIIQQSAWKHLESWGSNVQIAHFGNNVYSPSQIWHFLRQSDGSYKIINEYDGKCLDLNNLDTANGTNIQTWVDNGSNAQRWFLFTCGSGYGIRSACGDAVIDCTDGSTENGTNVEIWTPNGTSAQIFSIYDLRTDGTVYSKPAKPSASSILSTTNNGSQVTITWEESPLVNQFDQRTYVLKIWQGSSTNGSPYKTVYSLSNTSYSIPLSDGIYTASVSAVNNRYDWYVDGDSKTFTVSTHSHSYTSSITVAATCSATGIKTFTCSCGDSYTETIPINLNNHVNTKNVAATASTCIVKGYTAGVYCNDCKKYISGHAEQPLAAHTLTTQNAKAATCTAEGYTGDQVCTVCKQTITKGTAIAKKAHTLTTVNKAEASCTAAGYTGDQYCTTCNQTITKGSTVNALGHTSPDSNGNCTRCGTHIKDVTPSQPSDPQPNPNACKYCGKVHTGPFGWLIKFFHSILAIFKR